MKQLKMCRIMFGPVDRYDLPDGYSICRYSGEEDKTAWVECCRGGRLIDESKGVKAFDDSITCITEIDPYKDVFFLRRDGVIIGTATAFVRSDGAGDLHMVGIRADHRGKGLCRYLLSAALCKLKKDGAEYTYLTTDEFRKSAIKSYLTSGFLPVDHDTDMKERWAKVIYGLGIKSVAMLGTDPSVSSTLYAKSE